MARVYNFSAGPAALPAEVLDVIREDIPDWSGTGMSVMEVSHRGKEFVELALRCEENLRDLLAIPDDYDVLWIQGGATLQMAMAPLNLTGPDDCADYVVTGSWARKRRRKPENFAQSTLQQTDRVKISPGFPRNPVGCEQTMRPICISRQTRQSRASSFTSFRKVNRRLSRTCRAPFCRDPLTLAITALFTLERKKTLDLPALRW